MKKELFSEQVQAGSRTYFFDVKASVDGTQYLVISETRPGRDEPGEHHRVMVFQEHLSALSRAFCQALAFLAGRKGPRFHGEETLIELQEGLDQLLKLLDSPAKPEPAPAPTQRAMVIKDPRLERIRKKHLRAYDKWSKEEETRLRKEHAQDKTVNELAQILQRQPSAIRSRLTKLGLK